MIKRDEYLKKLIGFKDKQLIKVITGIRRCGKSTLLKIFRKYLLDKGVDENQIISINFENPDYDDLRDYKALYSYLKSKLVTDDKYYILLDEIQNVTDYQKAIDGLYILDNVDLYITGSNAYFMSGELATLLSGRYVEIQMDVLSTLTKYTQENLDEEIKELCKNYPQYRFMLYYKIMTTLQQIGNNDLLKKYYQEINTCIPMNE